MVTLFYRRGSFGVSEVFGTASVAMDKAYAMITTEGCSAFTIEEGGNVVMHHSQIEEQCQAVRATLLRGQIPARWRVQ